jgi:serine/threonine-protein kinase
MVHRDLKPGNIFLERNDGDENVKILDFGVVKEMSPSQHYERTKTGVLVGTVQYMSPEQASACRDIDHRSDLWSLGVILFRAITGCLPFTGASLYMIIKNIIAGPTPVPSHVVPDLSPEVDAFFELALARDVSKRFQSASAMAAAFQRLASPRSDDAITLPSRAAHKLPIALSSSEVMTVSSVELNWDDTKDSSAVSTSDLAPTNPTRRAPPTAVTAEVSEPGPSSMRGSYQRRPIFRSPWVLAGSMVTFLLVLGGFVAARPPIHVDALELPPGVFMIPRPSEVALPESPPNPPHPQGKSLLRGRGPLPVRKPAASPPRLATEPFNNKQLDLFDEPSSNKQPDLPADR